jgi:hypothetical protein
MFHATQSSTRAFKNSPRRGQDEPSHDLAFPHCQDTRDSDEECQPLQLLTAIDENLSIVDNDDKNDIDVCRPKIHDDTETSLRRRLIPDGEQKDTEIDDMLIGIVDYCVVLGTHL